MDTITLEQAIGQMLLLTFEGTRPPPAILKAIGAGRASGLTLFPVTNLKDPEQVRRLTGSLQHAAAAGGQPPLLIGADQEGGQLMAIGRGATAFPGNMALGATRSEDLAYRVGFATGSELAAMGINVNYAPVCDVNNNPRNPVVGMRAFGADPALVAALAAAQIAGLQAAGVAATAKHFPGHGDTATDSHHSLPVIPADQRRLEAVELPPFSAAIQAGVKLVMTAHLAVPAMHAGENVPATLSRRLLTGLLREAMGFEGLVVSDALNMKGISPDGMEVPQVARRAVAAGVDLLLLVSPLEEYQQVFTGLLAEAGSGALDRQAVFASAQRVLALKTWLASQSKPGMEVVGCAQHRDLALEVARRSMTLVRDAAGILPLHLAHGARLGVLLPEPQDLTPADTSSLVRPNLEWALRRYHPTVEARWYRLEPSTAEIAAVRQWAAGMGALVVGTINAFAFPAQASLVSALAGMGIPLAVVALRLPYDLQAFPQVATYACTYGIQPASMEALAEALFGRSSWAGRLPVSLEGI